MIITGRGIKAIGVHLHDEYELHKWLCEASPFRSNMMLGDFNAGDNIKSGDDNTIELNLKNYLMLTEGFVDICQGKYMTRYKTQIAIFY